MLEQQLKNEDNETIGTLSRAIKGARLRKWEISQECFNLVCRALQIPCDDGCNGMNERAMNEACGRAVICDSLLYSLSCTTNCAAYT